ncbi:hypothetical protein [Natronomonas gomsonensis]|uniref:hypothetical protein n=1 Tax=Natronomonas gomsonensis TaxID=1046043 RepID=UPI0015C01B87|nr:hypothetical protein [Natronomonas gomsonensis]
MVTATVIGAAIGGVIGSAIAGGANYYVTQKQIEAEDTRRYADYFLKEKVNSITDLHANLENCYQKYKFNWESSMSMDESEFENEIMSAFYDFEYAMRHASIFLDDTQMNLIEDAYEEFRWANGYFTWHVEYSDTGGIGDEVPEAYHNFNENEMLQAVSAARLVLKDEINEPAKYFED